MAIMVSLVTQQHARLHTLLVSFFLATTVGIVLYTIYAAFHYSSNAILGKDEANFIILSTQKIIAATNIHELIEGLFPSHGQHLLLGMQLVNLFTLFTFGVLDRRIMNVIGVVILCIAALLLPTKLRKGKNETILIYATIFPLILSPVHNACIVNASCTGNHYLGAAFSVFSLYFFTKIDEKKYFFIAAEFFMLLAIFSLPASLALIPISFFILATTPGTNKINSLFIHASLIILLLIFQYYLTYPNTIFSFMKSTGSISLSDALTDAILFCATFFIILGSMFYWLNDMGNAWILVIVGVMVSILFAIAILKYYKSRYYLNINNAPALQLHGTILFLLMILIIDFGRYYSFGSSRYAVYTAFLYSMLLLLFFSFINQSGDALHAAKRIKVLICSSTISMAYYFVALHYHQPYLLDLEGKAAYCRETWHAEGYACGVMIPHLEATHIIQSAIDQGIYRVEQ